MMTPEQYRMLTIGFTFGRLGILEALHMKHPTLEWELDRYDIALTEDEYHDIMAFAEYQARIQGEKDAQS